MRTPWKSYDISDESMYDGCVDSIKGIFSNAILEGMDFIGNLKMV